MDNKNTYSKEQVESAKILHTIVIVYLSLFISALINSLCPHYEFKGLYILKYYAQYGFLALALFSYVLTLISSIKLGIKNNKVLLITIILVPVYAIYSIIYNYYYHLYHNNYVNFLVFIEGIVFIIIQVIIVNNLKNKYGKEVTKMKDDYYKEDYLIGVNKTIDLPSSKFKITNGFLLAFDAFDLLPAISIVSFIYYFRINSNLYKNAIVFSIITILIELALLILFIIFNNKYKIYNYKFFFIIFIKILFIYSTFIISALIISGSLTYKDDPTLIGILTFFSFICYFAFAMFINITYPFYKYFIKEKYQELKEKEQQNNN